jgi:hypothetical protein
MKGKRMNDYNYKSTINTGTLFGLLLKENSSENSAEKRDALQCSHKGTYNWDAFQCKLEDVDY